MATYFTPGDLAEFVYNEFQDSKMEEKKPSESILNELFNTLYYTSLQTEEGQFIKVTITLLDHRSIVEFEQDRISYDNWKFFAFEPEIEFSVKNLIKLSKAADPMSSSLAVYYDDKEVLYIYGMIDQTIHYQNFLNYERESKPLHPGIMQTMINGIGVLNVMVDYQPVATLNQNSLVKKYPNVFEYGPVAAFIEDNAAYSHNDLELMMKDKLTGNDVLIYNEIILEYVIQSISRVLLRIRSYNHGGAILFTKNFTDDLNIKYVLKYNRIEEAIMHVVEKISDSDILNKEVKQVKRKKQDLPIALHEACEENKADIEDSFNELIGVVRFVSSLSCVDGLVLMSPHLTVKGFGVLIAGEQQPEYVYLNKNRAKINPSHFGTRHQSMFAYCLKNPDSLGFVVSQDGEIRAIMCIGGEVRMWENIKVYQFLSSSKMPEISVKK
ncbi:hypothetical protein H7F33_09770 [Pedobacter sp. PAMC26386]|nr:hypothetical protein H7F33_09770 [Pedobacter sp. PAMC26386]